MDAEVGETQGTLVLGSLEINNAMYRVTLDGDEVGVTAAQADVLATLVANRERVVSRDELARAARVDPGTVYVILSGLRRALGRDFVRNVRNRGWIVEPEAFGA